MVESNHRYHHVATRPVQNRSERGDRRFRNAPIEFNVDCLPQEHEEPAYIGPSEMRSGDANNVAPMKAWDAILEGVNL